MDLKYHNILINLFAGSVIPTIIGCFYCGNVISLVTAKILFVLFIAFFVVFPLIFKYSYKFQSSLVFLNFVYVPFNGDYAHPTKYGIDFTRNFYLETDDGMKLGVWQILPERLRHKVNKTDDEYYEKVLGDGQDVVLYMHGNAGTRMTDHRIELYKVLRKHFHVISFDYRSYGDSTNDSPSEDKLVKDAIFMYKWVANRTKGDLYVWGHSLGTSVTLHSLSILQKSRIEPKGVILESPFNNMRDEISEFPMAKIFKYLPWFQYTITEPMQNNGFTFQSDRYICGVDAPISILHSEDDSVVPFKLGEKLYNEAKECRRKFQGELTFHRFNRKYNYDHKYICRSPDLDVIIRNFIKEAKKRIKKEIIDR